MKILNLKFKNINSLAGENEIDFTTPVFTSDGLFAITGKTGSGKSSILDAISLALYGKTARVAVTGSENAVLTRGEKDCYAEIIFEVAGKKWKSSWSQELNRNGNLKPVNRIIADFDNNIIADQVRTCDTKIAEILGLRFEQFTKVIMLAQGSFTAFLQARQNEKGELLEQITGTEIYGEISEKVFERHREEKNKLEKISIELGAVKILSDEESTDLNNSISELEKERERVNREIQRIEDAKEWLNGIVELLEQINGAKQKLPELKEKVETAKTVFEKSENALKGVKEEQSREEPVFKEVRELDTKISEKEGFLQPVLNSICELEKSRNSCFKILINQKKGLTKIRRLLIEKQGWAIKNQKYEGLVANYSVIERESQLLVDSSTELNKLTSQLAELKKDLEQETNRFKDATELFDKKNSSLTAITEELEAKKRELVKILGGRELSKLRNERDNISHYSLQIKNLIDVEKRILENQDEIEKIGEKTEQFKISQKEFIRKIAEGEETVANLEEQIALLEENIRLTKTVQSLDQHRNNLKDGEQCPLCGSLEHPFAKGNIPKIGKHENQLLIFNTRLREAKATLQQNGTELVTLVSRNDNDVINREKEERSLNNNLERRKGFVAEIKTIMPDFLIPKGERRIELLSDIYVEKLEEQRSLALIIQQATDVETELAKLRDSKIPALQIDKETAEQEKTEAETAKKLAEQQYNNKRESVSVAEENQKMGDREFLKKLQAYSVESIEALKKCLASWNDNQLQIDNLAGFIANLKTQIVLNKNKLENKIALLDNNQKEKLRIETDKQKLEASRKARFGEKSVDEEESRLKKEIEAAEKAKADAEAEKNEANRKFEEIKTLIKEKEKDFRDKEEKKITEKTLLELEAESSDNKKIAEDCSQKIGGIRQILDSNEENLKESSEKLKAKEKQQAVFNKWGRLNTLIGSQDGKKYRNFAQALTFEYLIGLANKQLYKMSDRYILKRTGDSANPFELSVIDKFQNSEERTAQNLSGGENFIVSLSLALGLANMVSKNMSIDTMFIDEGFGTLDSDYLDVALNALSNLQSEGKIIGIISHLTELKERIATHIEVVPSGNGHSKIQITD